MLEGMADWKEQGDDTHTAKVGDYELKVRESKQFKSHGWVITRGHIVKAGDTGSLADAKKAAEAAVKILNKG